MTLPLTVSESRIEEGRIFARLMYFVACCGAAAHAVFLAVFAWYGWDRLVMMNAFSVLLYLGVLVGLRDPRRHRLMATLACAELIVHAVVAVLLLGWDSGFHLYLMGLVPIVFIGTSFELRLKWVCMVALGGGYALLRYVSHLHTPEYEIPLAALRGLEYFNIVGMVLILALGAHMHYGAVLRGERTLMWLASTDPLTGLPNRRHWLVTAQAAHERLHERAAPYSVLLADVDHFKSVNDRHGHGGGDEALRQLSRTLREALRDTDTIARWGGEEFAVLLADTQQADATRVAEDLCRRVAATDIRLDHQSLRLSMTIGAAEAQRGEALQSVVRRADDALYRGKAAGRNRVEQAAMTPDTAAPAPEPA